MNKIIKKLAVIREDQSDGCPFGLKPISFSCQNIGEFIDKMFPLNEWKEATEDDKKKIAAANTKLMIHILSQAEQASTQCKYAGQLFADKPDKVECNYGEPDAGSKSGPALNGFPEYFTTFNNMGFSGMFNVPVAYLPENNVMKNTYYGNLSLQGKYKEIMDKFVSLADNEENPFKQFLKEYIKKA